MAVLRDANSCYNSIVNRDTGDTAPRLTFEWYQIIDQLQAFFNNDPNVSVVQTDDLDNYSVTLIATSPCIAGALATVLNLNYQISGVEGKVHVMSGGLEYGPQRFDDLTELLQWAQVAFYGSPRVKGYEIQEAPPGFVGENAAIIVEKAVIQYYADNISDLYSNINKTTQDVLNELLRAKLKDNASLRVTTELNRDIDRSAIGVAPVAAANSNTITTKKR
ncbi:MAG: hypothetical protein LBS11_01235 [Oscillospiraceae bacterium]|jgi:hypothetical protein|nr:hypothetical protein [Oscillospiraceae bacterium]